jgi:hypothetical protein
MQSGERAHSEVVLENGLVAATLAPSNGGRIIGLRLLGVDCDFKFTVN